ncbi:MAG: NAD(P)/FAD-dependent oxidoreductase [Actinomycetota bacterium]
MDSDRLWDCVVVGGGAAGLSAALVLGRARKSTLLVDSGNQSNLPTHGIGGLLGHDGRAPAQLYAAGHLELAAYPTVRTVPGEVVGGRREGSLFVLDLAGGTTANTRRVVLATGMEYRFRQVPGMDGLWGRSVFHCPFCHGWEIRDRALAVLDNSAAGAHRALLLRGWTDEVTLLTDGPAQLSTADLDRLAAAAVTVNERSVARLRNQAGELTAIEFDGGSPLPCDALLVAVTTNQRSQLAEQLGAHSSAPGPVAANAVQVDARFETTAPGLFAAGDISAQMPSVANAIAAGYNAAAMVVHSLLIEDHNLAF